MQALPINIISTDVAGGAPATAALLAGVVIIALAARRACAKSPSQATLVVLQAIAGALLAFSPVALSPDPTSYVLFSRLYGVFGVNPYILPIALPHDSVLESAASVWGPSVPGDCYGPLWTLVAAGIAHLQAHVPFALQWSTHRLFAVAASVLTSLGLVRILRAHDRQDAVERAARFAFHPLVLIEAGINGHNDMLMVACAVWAFALLEEAPLAAGLLLGASVAIKFISVIIAPFFLVLLWRAREGRRRRSLVAAGAACAVFVVSFAPFWEGLKTLTALFKTQGWIESSPASLISQWYAASHLGSAASAPQVIDDVLLGIWATLAVMFILHFHETRERSAAYAAVLGFIWALPLVMSYYLLWLSPIAAERTWWGKYVGYLLTTAISCYFLAFWKFLSLQQVQDAYTLGIMLLPPVIVFVTWKQRA
jgi:hypothetical protein